MAKTTIQSDIAFSHETIEYLKKQPKTWITNSIVLLIIAVLLVWSFSAIDFTYIKNIISTLIHDEVPVALKNVWNMALHFFNPNRSYDPSLPVGLQPDGSRNIEVLHHYFLNFDKWGVPYLMFETVMIAFLGTLFGAIISVPFAFMSSKNVTGNVGSFIGAFIITTIRTFPIFVWGMIFVKIEPGPFAGVLAIAVSSIGMMSKLYVEVIEDIDNGIIEALDSTGATAFQKIRFGIIPQLIANFLSISLYRFEINVRNATILGLVSAGGIGYYILTTLGDGNYGILAVSLWGIIPVVLIVESISTRIRMKINSGA